MRSKLHQIGLINRDKIKEMDVIKIKTKKNLPKYLFFFILRLLKFTELPIFYCIIYINYNFSLTLRYLDDIIILKMFYN